MLTQKKGRLVSVIRKRERDLTVIEASDSLTARHVKTTELGWKPLS